MKEMNEMNETSRINEAPVEGLELVYNSINRAKKEKSAIRRRTVRKAVTCTAAVFACAVILLPNISKDAAYALSNLPVIGPIFEVVTIRDYDYSDENFDAQVQMPELKLIEDNLKDRNIPSEVIDNTLNAVNNGIEQITDKMINEFNLAVSEGEGHQQLYINYEILPTTDEYFCIKLITYVGMASGYECNFYYTIDMNDGHLVKLSDLYADDPDYLKHISENIKAQMRQQVAEGTGDYWIDTVDDTLKTWDFNTITDSQKFYVNEQGQTVIAFNEGDVAPMSMGAVEFVIENK